MKLRKTNKEKYSRLKWKKVSTKKEVKRGNFYKLFKSIEASKMKYYDLLNLI